MAVCIGMHLSIINTVVGTTVTRRSQSDLRPNTGQTAQNNNRIIPHRFACVQETDICIWHVQLRWQLSYTYETIAVDYNRYQSWLKAALYRLFRVKQLEPERAPDMTITWCMIPFSDVVFFIFIFLLVPLFHSYVSLSHFFWNSGWWKSYGQRISRQSAHTIARG